MNDSEFLRDLARSVEAKHIEERYMKAGRLRKIASIIEKHGTPDVLYAPENDLPPVAIGSGFVDSKQTK